MSHSTHGDALQPCLRLERSEAERYADFQNLFSTPRVSVISVSRHHHKYPFDDVSHYSSLELRVESSALIKSQNPNVKRLLTQMVKR